MTGLLHDFSFLCEHCRTVVSRNSCFRILFSLHRLLPKGISFDHTGTCLEVRSFFLHVTLVLCQTLDLFSRRRLSCACFVLFTSFGYLSELSPSQLHPARLVLDVMRRGQGRCHPFPRPFLAEIVLINSFLSNLGGYNLAAMAARYVSVTLKNNVAVLLK